MKQFFVLGTVVVGLCTPVWAGAEEQLELLANALHALAKGQIVESSEKCNPAVFVDELKKINPNAFLYSDPSKHFYQLAVVTQSGQTCMRHAAYNVLWIMTLLAAKQAELKPLYMKFRIEGAVGQFVGLCSLDQGVGIKDAAQQGLLPANASALFSRVSDTDFFYERSGITKEAVERIKDEIKLVEGELPGLDDLAREAALLNQRDIFFGTTGPVYLVAEQGFGYDAPNSLAVLLYRFHEQGEALEGIQLNELFSSVTGHATALVACRVGAQNWYFYANSMGTTPSATEFWPDFAVLKRLFDSKQVFQDALVRAVFAHLRALIEQVETFDFEGGLKPLLQGAAIWAVSKKRGVFETSLFKNKYQQFFKVLGGRFNNAWPQLDDKAVENNLTPKVYARFKQLPLDSFSC